uniref:Uncharacterized protein n=1 Tax=Quercus lobata TaxID=97700 RepID=A0A7N2MHC7_QUELO
MPSYPPIAKHASEIRNKSAKKLNKALFLSPKKKRNSTKEGVRPSSSENFSLSGPNPRVDINWNDVNYRRLVIACLVNGVYILESDRQQNRDEIEALATPCFQLAMDCVLVTMSGGARVWLAGHSPGSAMALLAGKNMAKMGYFLETYLFNPPFLYFPMEAAIKDTIVKFVIRCAGSVVSAGLSRDVNGCQHHETEDHESFNVPLSSWIPYLFVNPHYPICSEYIGYFEQRKKMRAKILGGVDRFLTKSCMDSGSEPLNLIPSADLTINRCQLTEFQGPFCKYKKFKRAHGIQQWWNYVPYDSLRYEYNTTNYVE